MLGLRLREGFNLRNFKSRYRVTIEELAGPALKRSFAKGLTEISDENLRLTSRGLLIADTVIADFLADD
jgi:oxygen-independent coproporphyrinogen-3 oxidase